MDTKACVHGSNTSLKCLQNVLLSMHKTYYVQGPIYVLEPPFIEEQGKQKRLALLPLFI